MVKSCMSGRAIELRAGGGGIDVRFPFDPKLAAVMRGLSRRRFDQIAKCWSCPVEAIVEVVDTLLPFGFEVGAEARALYVARGGTQTLAAVSSPRGPSPCQ
jgi:hypothetical protein